MGTRTKYATWRRDGRLYVVRPPDWPRDAEYSCTSKLTLVEWAKAHHYMLRDGNPREERRYGTSRTKDA